MLLLTWHGTILRVEQSQSRLIHSNLVPLRPLARDFAHPPGAKLPGGLAFVPGPRPPTVHLTRGAQTLTVDQNSPFPTFEPGDPGDHHTLLPISEEAAAALRALLAGPLHHTGTGETHPPATLHAGFRLAVGARVFDLVEARPTVTGDGIILPGDAAALVPLPSDQGAAEHHLRRDSASAAPTADAEIFRAAAAATLVIAAPAICRFLPLTANAATRDWLVTQAGAGLRTGPQPSTDTLIHHQRHVFVAGAAIFTRDALLLPPPTDAAPPAALSREADEFFAAEAALAAAPSLAGPHALLPLPVNTMLPRALAPLALLAAHLPPDTTLLLPAEDARLAAMLELFGLAHLRRAVAPPLCAVEDLFWLDPAAERGAAALRAARAASHHHLPPPPPRRRGLLLPAGLAAPADIAAALAKSNIDPLDQAADTKTTAASCAAAGLLIAAAGPALENLLFCRDNTGIIELTPDTAWSPRYSHLSDQLNLGHAVLPCPADADGALRPDPARLKTLVGMLQARP
jgi:hypothetical protein